jgi:lycopene beta-cyclase
MTYLEFHALFSLPALLIAGACARRAVRRAHAPWLTALCAIVVLFTTPWDAYAVATGIWDFGEGTVLFRILRLPIEEYAFFILQTVTVGLLTIALLRPAASDEEDART